MKKHVEDKMKNAVESWEEKPSEIGFDKALVWDSIQGKASTKKTYINWYKVAVAVIFLLITWGWGNSYFNNQKLMQERVVMVGNIQTLGNEIKQMQHSNQEQSVIREVITDTVIKVIYNSKETESIKYKYQDIEQQNIALLKEITLLNQQLKVRDREYQILTDSFYVLGQNLEAYKNQIPYDLALLEDNKNLKVDEEALSALSQESKEKINLTSNPQKKIKITLFNKSKPSKSMAPASRGIRL